MMETLEQIGSNPSVMKWSGLVVLAMLGFGFMRVRRHPMRDALAFGGGILGVGIVIGFIQYIL